MQILFGLVVDTFNAGGMLSRILLDFHVSELALQKQNQYSAARDFCITQEENDCYFCLGSHQCCPNIGKHSEFMGCNFHFSLPAQPEQLVHILSHNKIRCNYGTLLCAVIVTVVCSYYTYI